MTKGRIEKKRTEGQKAARTIGLVLLIAGGIFAIWAFGAGLIAFMFVSLVFLVLPSLPLLYIGRRRWREEGDDEEEDT